MLQLLSPDCCGFPLIGCGLIAGLYFAFSAFIMTALGRIGQAAGITAMNAINAVIVQSLFMPLFLGTTVASLRWRLQACFAGASRARPRCWPAACSM